VDQSRGHILLFTTLINAEFTESIYEELEDIVLLF